MANFEVTSKIYELRKRAEAEGRDDILQQLDALQSGMQEPEFMSREARLYEPTEIQDREDLENFNLILEKTDTLLERANQENRPDLIEPLIKVREQAQAGIYDIEDITEEIRGAGSAALEAVTVGIVGDEAQAKMFSIITGVPYETALKDFRRIQSEFAEDKPVADIGIRLGAGLLPSIALSATAGVGSSALGGFARQAGVTTAELATLGYMEGEGGVGSRVQSAVDLVTDPLALGAVGIAGGAGAFLGRGVQKAAKLEEDLAAAVKAEDERLLRLNKGADETVGTDVIEVAQRSGDELVLNFYNQNGRLPEGLEISELYKQIADETGVSLNRILQSEFKGAERRLNLDYRNQSIGDIRKRVKKNAGEGGFKSPEQATYYKGFVREFWEKKFESVVNVAKDRLGGNIAGNMQRMATRMAQNQQSFDTVFNGKPVQAFASRLEHDKGNIVKQHILNFGNVELEMDKRLKYFENFKKMLTKEEFEGYTQLVKMRQQQAMDYRRFVFRELSVDPLYFPSEKMNQVRLATYLTKAGRPDTAVDVSLKEISRGELTALQAADYENPMIIMREKLARDDALIEMHRAFGLENVSNRIGKPKLNKKGKPTKKVETESEVLKDLEEGQAVWKELERTLKYEKASDEVIAGTRSLARALIVKGAQSPSGWIANFRKAAYMGTIGNPYSAFLNFGDVSNTVVNFGADNMAISVNNYFKSKGIMLSPEEKALVALVDEKKLKELPERIVMDVSDVGLIQQSTGDFLREGATGWNRRFNAMSDITFNATGFRKADMIGKAITLNAAVARGKQMAVDGSLFREYNWLFGRRELAQLRSDLINNRKTQLVREFAGAELAKLQPSDMAQMPQWYLNHPDGRILYMLRTFGIKQLQQLNRLVLETWKEGARTNNPEMKKQAVKNLVSYFVIVGGGNTLLNELRQPLKGEAPFDEDRAIKYFVDYMIAVASINSQSTYTLEKLAEGDASAAIRGFFPAAVDMTEDIVGDFAVGVSGNDDWDDLFFEGKGVTWAPFMRTAQPFLEETFD